MDNDKWISRSIPVKDLLLWDENARFSDKYFKKTEKELIDYFCSKDNFEILKLSQEVVEDFDLPQLEKLVIYNCEGKNIVLEGNRRLTVYKLLIDPVLIDNVKLKSKIILLKSKIDIDENFKVECLVTEDKVQGYRYIDRKHLKNNNEKRWGETERTFHRNRMGSASRKELFKIRIAEVISRLDIPEGMREGVLGFGYVSNLWRILDTSIAWGLYGFDMDSEGNLHIEDEDFTKNLKVIILNILNKKDFRGNTIDSRSLNKNQEKIKYLRSIKSADWEKAQIEIKKWGKANSAENKPKDEQPEDEKPKEEAKKNSKSKPMPKGLFYSSDVPYKKGNKNLRILYEEMKNIDVENFPNATHDLLRSFLECSLIVFFKANGEFDSINKRRGNPTLGEMLTHIINKKSSAITDINLIQAVSLIKSEYDAPHSLQTLNMINHNENWVSSPRDVRIAWARLEELFKLILLP